MELKRFFVDLHVHIGRDSHGRPVKVSGARNLTFENIAKECFQRKGIDVVGIVDSASPRVIEDIESLLDSGEMAEIPGGGVGYRGRVAVLLASEVETREDDGGSSHHLVFFRGLDQAKGFSRRLAKCVANIHMSTPRCGMPARRLYEMAYDEGGVPFPAHAFSPHKSIYGNCVRRLSDAFPPDTLARVPAIELGLSADTDLADTIGELTAFTFLSNSDCHSLGKIGREYNEMLLGAPSFDEVMKALFRKDGRSVVRNFGLDPRLGKYHRTFCPNCGRTLRDVPPPAVFCPHCPGSPVVMGVLDRIVQIQDHREPRHPAHRPPYQYQVPLEFVPGIGPRAIDKLIQRFGSEMAILHDAKEEDIAAVVGAKAAHLVIRAREGSLPLLAGGGGRYGKALADAD
ncbi:MAG: endonuclease Q family protein [Betaproteobacteria bacterium]